MKPYERLDKELEEWGINPDSMHTFSGLNDRYLLGSNLIIIKRLDEIAELLRTRLEKKN